MKCLHKGVGMGALFAALAASVATIGCSSANSESAESNTGKVSMQLTGQTNGNTYRLRNARFDVTGTQSLTLDSESDLTSSTLNATLATGDYSINLEPGWSLERSDAGAFDVVNASLVSQNPQAFQILGGGTTNIAFQFTTDGTLVTIGTGELNVSIGVTETGAGGSGGSTGGQCMLAAQTGCPSGQACYFTGNTDGTGECLPPGTSPFGGACDGTEVNQCVAGGVCGSTPSTCFQMCAVGGAACPGGKTCVNANVGGNLGVCL